MGEDKIRRVDAATRGAISAEAAAALDAGKLVILPTETVYGLAADATNGEAVARIFAAKDRPRFNPLIAHVADREMAEAHGVFDDAASLLADRFWPGPLTLVVPKREGSGVSDLAIAGLPTLAIRLPRSETARSVVAALGRPVAAPSANRSGRVSATTVEAAFAEVGEHAALAIDDGPCPVGVESTIVGCTCGDAVMLRPGGVAREEIEAALGRPLASPPPEADAPVAPGMLASHYAPAAMVRLDVETVAPGEALLAFGPAPVEGWQGARAMMNLSHSGDLVEAAANLFAHLRALDGTGASTIAVMPIPSHGLGEAINDRLRRAAAPR